MPVNGNLYYSVSRERGEESPPLVLLHGAGGMHLYWPAEVRRLPGHCVYALDLPGHGKSELCDGQQTIDDYARYIVGWLESIHLRRAVLVGHSMGAAIAMLLAIHHPEYVVGLALVGAGARLRVHPELLGNAADPTTFYKAADMLVSCSFSPKASPRLVELASSRMDATRQSVLYGDLLACDRFDVMSQLKDIRQQTLVICGEDDQMTPVRYAQYLAGSISDSRLTIIPNAGHMVMLEQPRHVADRLSAFVNDISFHPGEGD